MGIPELKERHQCVLAARTPVSPREGAQAETGCSEPPAPVSLLPECLATEWHLKALRTRLRLTAYVWCVCVCLLELCWSHALRTGRAMRIVRFVLATLALCTYDSSFASTRPVAKSLLELRAPGAVFPSSCVQK
eukprot:2365082-Alexandrium_andersonii.AAC.1